MNNNLLYFEIVSYATCLCVFITVWVVAGVVAAVWKTSGVFEVESESSLLELVWTVVPTFWVFILCVCNVGVVLSSVEASSLQSVKIVGRQWYWSFESGGLDYDSFMGDLVNSVDKPLQLFWNQPTRLLVSSSDVIHSFSIPDLGLKVDAIPGRINQLTFIPDRVGMFVGYCSELCGTGHSYMPINAEVVYAC